MEPSKANEKLEYRGYVVAVLDLLGQTEAIEHLDTLRPRSAADPEIIQALNDSIGKRNAVRDLIKSCFSQFISKVVVAGRQDLNVEEQKAVDLLRQGQFKSYNFADTTVAYLRLVTQEDQPRVSAIFQLLEACADVMIGTLARGWPVRGAIELGYGLEPEDNEIYGPAFLRAYKLERKVAFYPRIVIGPGLASYLLSLLKTPPSSPIADVVVAMAKRCLKLVTQHENDVPFVHYLGDEGRRVIHSMHPDEQLFEQAFAFARGAYSRFIKSKPCLAKRYATLCRYFERWASAWRKPV